MLGELTGEHQADGRLHLAGRQGRLVVVGAEFAGLSCDLGEDVVDEGVHDGHSLLGHASVWVDLLENLVDVDSEGLGALLAALGGGCFLSFLGQFEVLKKVLWFEKREQRGKRKMSARIMSKFQK